MNTPYEQTKALLAAAFQANELVILRAMAREHELAKRFEAIGVDGGERMELLGLEYMDLPRLDARNEAAFKTLEATFGEGQIHL